MRCATNTIFTREQLRNALRGIDAARFCEGVNLVPISPDLTEVFPDAEAVNQALRAREAAD
ncbi:hypothetical protein [Longimicrobium sp.]|uniref:hypothetical protein n=1 Tax=Longimicrobium sp. TaxID=2029185 RepID=UPI003B3A9C17